MGGLMGLPSGLENEGEQQGRQQRAGAATTRGRRRRALHRRPYPQRVFREHFPYMNFTEDQCMRHLRFTKEIVTELCHLLHPQLEPQTRAWTALPVTVKVTVTLNVYVVGSFQAAAGDISDISQFTVHRFVREVTEALDTRRNTYISFPMNRAKQDERSLGFNCMAGCPKLVCDHRQHITQVCSHDPVTSHDSSILRQSSVLPLFQPGCQVTDWLLDDKNYPFRTWLMTPVRRAAKHANNKSHAAIIEQTIDMLEQRFRCLDRSRGALQSTPEQVSRSVVVSCMLHNFAFTTTWAASSEEEERERGGRAVQASTTSARTLRDQLIQEPFIETIRAIPNTPIAPQSLSPSSLLPPSDYLSSV
ncbi:putative nuclease HARBI1 [Heptranchias perlo]|uniref:putative nuclease HARBI1 n=1 Tax=Heptranchias perlo TaxID=212740 RepID=UPI00355A0CA6